MSDYKNISVRLDEEDYKKLNFITDFFNENSYFKGSYADTLRIAVNKLYTEINHSIVQSEKQEIKETKENKPKSKRTRIAEIKENNAITEIAAAQEKQEEEGQEIK